MFVDIKEPALLPPDKILGIDRGVSKIATLSNNTFINSRKLRNVIGKHQHMRRVLTSKGTKSTKRLLKRLSGKETRFRRDVNHCITKHIVGLPFDTFVLEDLHIEKSKKNGKRFNALLGTRSWFQFEQFLRYKSALVGKRVELVDARYTSQKCSKCGHIDRNNRHGHEFKCKACSFRLNSDLNASRNIRNNFRASLGTPLEAGCSQSPVCSHEDRRISEQQTVKPSAYSS